MPNKTTMQDFSVLFRVARKQAGLTQIEASKILGLEQSALSRIENGRQSISIATWFHMASLAGVSSDSMRYGYLETNYAFQGKTDHSSFRLPKRFSKYRKSKIRASLPILGFAKRTAGQKFLNDFLEKNKIDPDFLINIDNTIDIDFNIELTSALIQSGTLKKSAVHQLTKDTINPIYHGSMSSFYSGKDNSTLFRALIENSSHYDTNHDYDVLDHKDEEIVIAIRPQEHVRTDYYKHHPILGNFVCNYRDSYFKNFRPASDKREVKVTHAECYHKKNDRCVYQVKWC